MAKGYWVGVVDVSDPEAYKAYVHENAVAFKKFGARFLVRGGRVSQVEGSLRSRVVVIEFSDYQTALDCYHSSEYAKAKALRENVSLADIVVVEGYTGPQPDQS
jgi:uncharacterized protein (DUF1330 family)